MKLLSLFRSTLASLFLALICSVVAPTSFALDINTASAEQLQTLKGIGPKRAEAIITYRDKNGPFKTVEELLAVPGVGQSIIDDNREALELASGEVASSK